MISATQGNLWSIGRVASALAMLLLNTCFSAAAAQQAQRNPDRAALAAPMAIRVVTFNVEDIRTEDLRDGSQPRVRQIAEVIQRLQPTVILLNEIAYDQPGAPGFRANEPPGQNGRRFVENYLMTPQAQGLSALEYNVFMAPSNTGIPSGFDLNKDGRVVTEFPPPPGSGPNGEPGEQTDGGRAFGEDCWGFGTFPGQYAMALLVDPRCEILIDQVRTFRLLPWEYMPGAALPQNPEGSGSWYSEEELKYFRLSSKSHWDVPVRMPNGSVVHFLCSHPTPPAFDGPERRNARRNYDEIRFWADYIEGAQWIVDDHGVSGPLERGELFVILGDLNADPEKGTAYRNPMKELLFASRRLNPGPAPVADIDIPGLSPTDTASWKRRVDYVLPSQGITTTRSGVWRTPPPGAKGFPSDHFPVWADLVVPPPPTR
ncbi:MAG: endonuclease/exonuclease/phosphatase family protein [Phycisphaeraceae bacterium]|nr:endonuclease/exonuclease/phosphatase family protein [Phycisphaeraceae bacterium]